MSGKAERVFPPAVNEPPKPASGTSPAAGGKGADWTKDKRVWGAVGAGIVVVLAMFGRGGSSGTVSSGSTAYDEAPEPAEPGEYASGSSDSAGLWDAIAEALAGRNDELPAEPAETPEQGDVPTAVAPAPASVGKPTRPQRGPKAGRGGKGRNAGKGGKGGKGGKNQGARGSKGGKNQGARGGKSGGGKQGGRPGGRGNLGNNGGRPNGGKSGGGKQGGARARIAAVIPGRKAPATSAPRKAAVARPAPARQTRAASGPRPGAAAGRPVAPPAARPGKKKR